MEGAELEALQGAKRIITENRPKLAVCFFFLCSVQCSSLTFLKVVICIFVCISVCISIHISNRAVEEALRESGMTVDCVEAENLPLKRYDHITE